MSRATIVAGIQGKNGMADLVRWNPAIVNAAGSNSQANSTLLTTTVTIIASLTAVTTRGVRLINFPATGTIMKVISAITTNCKVYPGTSAKLGTGATANANVSLAALKCKTWIAQNQRQWVAVDTLA